MVSKFECASIDDEYVPEVLGNWYSLLYLILSVQYTAKPSAMVFIAVTQMTLSHVGERIQTYKISALVYVSILTIT